MNTASNYFKIEETFDYHSSIIMILSEKIVLKVNIVALAFKTTNWQHFQNEVKGRIKLNVTLKTNKISNEYLAVSWESHSRS